MQDAMNKSADAGFENTFRALLKAAVKESLAELEAERAGTDAYRDPGMYTRKEAAALAKVSLPQLDQWIRSEGLPVFRVGRNYRIPADEYHAWLRKHVASGRGGAEHV